LQVPSLTLKLDLPLAPRQTSYLLKVKKKIIFFAAVLTLAAGVLLWKIVFPPPSPPNIVLIIVDALRADRLGCYGFPEPVSPEIDALAAKGVLFEKVISQCSWTRPSIGSMITGQYPRTLGIYREQYDILADKYLTLAEILKANGYRTYGITANPNINQVFNFQQGFDEYRDSRAVWQWMKPAENQEKVGDDIHLPQSREIFDAVVQKARSYNPKDGPVFIQVNIMEVHSPYLTRPEYKNRFHDYPVKPVHFKYSATKLENLVRWTLGAIQQVSHDLGDLVQRLSRLPGWENTLLVITSDHGQGLDDHPDVPDSTAHGNLLYDSHLRVPLIFYWLGSGKDEGSRPGLKPHRVKERVRLLDLMPTLLDCAGIKLPGKKNASSRLQGYSLLGLLKAKGNPPHLPEPEFDIAETNWRKVNKIAVYGDKWIYIENRDGWPGVNRRELQPVGLTENGKLTDKIQEEPQIAQKMKQFLSQWERTHKRSKPTFPRGTLTEKEIQQLKSLGYLN
jgi:arylsulfatase A-like enzyme